MAEVSSHRATFPQVALLISLGVNLFFVGWMAGERWFHPWPDHHGRAGLGERLRGALSENGSAIMREAFNRVRGEFESNIDAMRASRARIQDTIARNPFDRSAFLNEMRMQRELRGTAQDRADEAMADAIMRLSDDDRHRLAALQLFPPGPDRRPPPH